VTPRLQICRVGDQSGHKWIARDDAFVVPGYRLPGGMGYLLDPVSDRPRFPGSPGPAAAAPGAPSFPVAPSSEGQAARTGRVAGPGPALAGLHMRPAPSAGTPILVSRTPLRKDVRTAQIRGIFHCCPPPVPIPLTLRFRTPHARRRPRRSPRPGPYLGERHPRSPDAYRGGRWRCFADP
jgi:hypothetical protein